MTGATSVLLVEGNQLMFNRRPTASAFVLQQEAEIESGNELTGMG